MKTVLVLTTIYDPICLEGYFDNFKRFGHLDEVEVILISDEKTPVAALERCGDLNKRGLRIHFAALPEQDNFVESLNLSSRMFPRNSDNRRNVGYLMALKAGADIVISIDDDNFCLPDHDYLANHALMLAAPAPSEALESSTGWINTCDHLFTTALSRVYQRGFPYGQREISETFEMNNVGGPVLVNQGLWLGEPDVDAVSWMATPCKSERVESRNFIVGINTWSPINSQNTAVVAEAIPAYYFLPMIANVMDHDGDIFQGYFLQKCIKHFGGLLRFGTPVVNHKRNSHNYLKDLRLELPCIEILEIMLPWLTNECKVSGSDYCEAYESLSYAIEEFGETEKIKEITARVCGFPLLAHWANYMRQWSKACKLIGTQKYSRKG